MVAIWNASLAIGFQTGLLGLATVARMQADSPSLGFRLRSSGIATRSSS